MPWHYKVSRQSAATHWICQTCRKYTGSVSKTNDILNIKPNQMVKYSRTTPWTSCHAWPNHMWPWQPNSKVSSTNITIVIIHSIQNCRNMLVNYVLHSHDIIMERYAYKKRRMETDNIPGDPTPISFQRCRRHEWLTRWNSGVTVKWINYYRPLSYITSPILYEPIDLIPWTHHDNVPI